MSRATIVVKVHPVQSTTSGKKHGPQYPSKADDNEIWGSGRLLLLHAAHRQTCSIVFLQLPSTGLPHLEILSTYHYSVCCRQLPSILAGARSPWCPRLRLRPWITTMRIAILPVRTRPTPWLERPRIPTHGLCLRGRPRQIPCEHTAHVSTVVAGRANAT